MVTLTRKGKQLSGNVAGENGKTEFESVSASEKTVRFEFQLDIEGTMRDIEIEAKLQTDGTLDGEWAVSVVGGDKVEHWLNGDKVAEAEIGSDAWNEKIASSKFAT